MPWTAADAASHTKKADTPAKQKKWAAVANDALARCLDDDGDQATCEAAAIKQANAVAGKATEEGSDEMTEQTTGAETPTEFKVLVGDLGTLHIYAEQEPTQQDLAIAFIQFGLQVLIGPDAVTEPDGEALPAEETEVA